MKATKPKKAEGAICNTWIVDIDGSVGDGYQYRSKVLTVRFTSDTHETLSIADEAQGIQYIVPFKKVNEMIELARNAYKKN